MKMFPSRFKTPQSIEYYGLIKEKTITMCDYMVKEEPEKLEKIEKLGLKIATYYKPNLLDGNKGSIDIEIEKEQNQLMVALEEMGISNPEKLSVLKFYSLVEKKELDKKEKSVKQNGKGRI